MMHVRPSLYLALGMTFVASACASSDKTLDNGANAVTASCDDEGVGTDCVCDDDADGVVECVDDVPECVCDKPTSKPETKKDAGKAPVEDAGKTPVTPPKVDAGKPDAGKPTTPTPTPDPAPVGGGGAPVTPVTGGADPVLPAIVGECPEFKNGTIMAAGHKSIVITAGAAGKGGPLVFYWHGTGSSAAESRLFAGVSDVVAQGGIVASFNGNQSGGGGSDCSGTGAHNMNDFKAADLIAACAVKNHGIDPKKIFTTGCSAGGLQSGCMGMVRSSYVAAVAPNSGGITFAQKWQDAHSPAVFTMHGGSSDMVVVTFSQTSKTFDSAAKTHGSVVVNCDHGGGHCQAPGDLQKAAWKFMQENPFGAKDSPWKTAIPAGVPSYCKIF